MREVYEIGYNNKANAPYVERLMQEDPRLLLIDTRLKPWSQHPDWRRAALTEKYGKRYRWAGSVLGNINYKGGPITIVDLATGIDRMIEYVQRDFNLLLLCACPGYTSCHRKVIVEALVEELQCRELPPVDVVHSFRYKNLIA